MKRCLCIVSSLDTGGAETFMMKIFRSLPKEYKLDFVVSTSTGFYEAEVKKLGGRIFRIPLRTKHPVKSFEAIKHIVKKYKYETVLKLCDTPKGYFDLLATKKGGAKNLCVRSCNASSSESNTQKRINDFLRPAFNKIATVKLAPSKLAAEYTFGKDEVASGKVYLLHNAVDLDVYKYSELGRKKIRDEFGVREDQLVVGHIGRFNQQKNHKFLIDVFYEILKKRNDAVLMLVGEGETEKEVAERAEGFDIADNVIFTGVRSDIPDLLSAMDVFVFPSFYEGMPNTIIEAQATGLPCVLSDTITREAQVTNLLTYLSLKCSAKDWAQKAIEAVTSERKDTKQDFIKAGYNIEYSVSKFIEWIF